MKFYKLKSNCPKCGSLNICPDVVGKEIGWDPKYMFEIDNKKIVFPKWSECNDCGCTFNVRDYKENCFVFENNIYNKIKNVEEELNALYDLKTEFEIEEKIENKKDIHFLNKRRNMSVP